MREIKFRAWDSFNNRMIQNDRILKICFLRSNHIPSLVIYSNRNIENHTEIRENDKQYCNEFELMQYTGLKDKNGKEIYEGDIISRGKYNFEVVWNERKGWYGIDDFDNGLTVLAQHLDYVEVIGNIYENLELLKENR